MVENYGLGNVLDHKMANKLALQKELGLEEDEGKFVIGLISRLTNQKGLDLVSAVIPQVMDGNTQVVILGTGDREFEDTFRYYEGAYKGQFAACIQYDESRAHRIYAGADALLVPSRFEPCGLTQLNAMHYGTLPIVRETGGLKDTVEPITTSPGAATASPLTGTSPACCWTPSTGQDLVFHQPLPLGRGGSAGHGQGRLLGELCQAVQRAVSGADPVVKESKVFLS